MKLLPIPLTNYWKRLTQPQATSLRTLSHEKQPAAVRKNKKRLSFQIKEHRLFKTDFQQDELRKAIQFAQDPIRPDRSFLLALYEETMRDPQLLSLIRTNILKAIGSPFAVFKAGTDTIDEQATEWLAAPWFNQLQYLFHETPYYGHTLLEFQPMKVPFRKNGLAMAFDKIKVFPRQHVRPETQEIILDYTRDKGLKYTEAPWNEWLLEIGGTHDIGLLHIAARYVIWKNYSLTDWSKMIERFGLPTLVIKTDEQKTEELDNIENMAKNFGSNLYAMLDKEDDFDVQWPRVSQGHTIFKDKCDFCDSQLSKLVAGQESTSSEKAYVGAAEVHERILNAYMEQAMRSETYYHNHVLFPFLMQHGYPLEGLEFRYLAFTQQAEGTQTYRTRRGQLHQRANRCLRRRRKGGHHFTTGRR